MTITSPRIENIISLPLTAESVVPGLNQENKAPPNTNANKIKQQLTVVSMVAVASWEATSEKLPLDKIGFDEL
jgi:hypothetical protein